ncbi:MAG: glycosyltransferase family 2 protein [Candidatus Omnitrophica bacterium]|nr:glycosyltransferase family 2 protein [Candidatus Omnitrophota bacterium]
MKKVLTAGIMDGQAMQKEFSRVSIIMASYNGSRFLKEQIESILAQTYGDWLLIIRDDGSRDGTVSLIKEYLQKYPGKIKFLSDNDGHLGISGNFFRLISLADAPYIMFCDQDDVWLPDKIEATLDKMKKLEEASGADTALLVHTDLKVADEGLDVIAESFWRYQNLAPEKGKKLNRLLAQNVITGCATMINRALKEKIRLIPGEAISYDWWVSIVAAAFGKIGYIPKPTMLYRQHAGNNIGAKRWGLSYIKERITTGMGDLRETLLKTQRQAGAFLKIYGDELPPKSAETLTVYSNLGRQNLIVKRLDLIRYRFFKIGFQRNIGLFLAI